VAGPTSSGASSASKLSRWLTRLAGVLLLIVGAGCVVVGGQAYLDAWSTARDWETSPEAQDLARQAVEPTPIFVADTPEPLPVDIQPLPTPQPTSAPAAAAPLVVLQPTDTATPEPSMATADQIQLDSAEFRFLEPPQPDAHARVSVTLRNTAAGRSGPLLLGIPATWFDAYRIIGSVPAVTEDRTDDEGLRTFTFPSIAGGQAATFELHVAPIGEDIPAPSLQVLLANGDAIDGAKPSTVAPPPRPGPAMGLDIPRLNIKSGVVQTKWEPPPFTIGQIRGTANVSTGNTVLVGHLTGAAGNVFAHLDQLEPGDEITATSRGLPYQFVVSQILHGSNMDTTPMQPDDDDPKLTLMTCAGVWNPVTRDYSERIWVIAEPPDQAKETIARVAVTATAEAAATRTAVALLPTPTPSPTPYAGEPSLAGGLGNTRADLGKQLGAPLGETTGKLVVFRQPGREYHVHFTPERPRAAMLVILPSVRMAFADAVKETRKFFPRDTQPRLAAPEGNPLFALERFSSDTLGIALGTDSGDFSVIYVRDAQGQITRIVLGLGDDIDALLDASLQ
jgi:LPXTG-site transpeptidase (sortase) family protein